MNRREFCLTTGLLLAGSVCGNAVPMQTEKRTKKVCKVFLESWDAKVPTVSFVRQKLEAIRRNGYNGLILVPGRCSASKWMEQIETEATRLGLSVFVPTRLPADLFRKVRMVQRLDDDGFLLSDGSDSVLGLVLYDVSRCRWTEFMPNDSGKSDFHENASQLFVARWLDRQVFSV
jgi:hypothetical protein